MVNYRHGDLALIGIDKLPEGLNESKTKVLLNGKSNTHSINKGQVYLKNVGEFVIGYLVAKDTSLLHKEHGKVVKGKSLREAKIKDGVYELRVQHEDTNKGMKRVED